jgi:hypothetical protein
MRSRTEMRLGQIGYEKSDPSASGFTRTQGGRKSALSAYLRIHELDNNPRTPPLALPPTLSDGINVIDAFLSAPHFLNSIQRTEHAILKAYIPVIPTWKKKLFTDNHDSDSSPLTW